ncbi:MAG TPA: hypothetical protein PKM43_09730 [Verrucomicrobiota bacterium]|nr:hypothetical protein [Verrucomicrobiota bacterium]
MKTKSKTHILLVISSLALAPAPGHAQADGPLVIIWQAAFGPGPMGGAGWANPADFVQTSDGGFLIAGGANGPANGIRTEPICGGIADVWVIKIDGEGQRLWDKSYGGSAGEEVHRIILTPDGGFLLTGTSMSPPSCTKTSPHYPEGALWAVRCDANGNQLWDQCYLTPAYPALYAYDCVRTADGAYLACGRTAGWGIVKFDDSGEKLWAMNLGPKGEFFQLPLAIRETGDGGFIVAGSSDSPTCAQKSSLYYGGLPQPQVWRGSDFWVVRVDAQGNRVWDKSYGGQSAEQAYVIHPTSDGGFMVFGSSQSVPPAVPRLGTKTSPRYGMLDYWIIKIDAEGNQLWDKSYGGTSDDILTHAEPMPDGGWLLCGQSTSLPFPRGGKTSPRFGGSDFWIVRIDEQGNRLWDQSFGGSDYEGRGPALDSAPVPIWLPIKRAADGGFLLVGFSVSPVSGLKTEPLISGADYWVLKLGPEPPFLRGEVTAEGKFQLLLIGPPEFQHTIQGSADLATWVDLVTFQPNPAGKEYWTDPDRLAHRFYRAVRR